ncbi:MAG TPA: glycosyltransferase family 2 protein [Gammaproteobacteria bacterium]|jgi:GT2 family glycosyltransferase
MSPDGEGVAALVLEWNGSAETIRAVRSVLKSEPPVDRVFVLINGSSAGHREALRREFGASDRIVLHESDVNLGFAGGVNHLFRRLMEQPDAPGLLLLLNNDAEVEPRTIARLARAVLEDQRIGIAGPRILRTGTDRVIADDGAAVIPWLLQQRFRGAGRKDSEIPASAPRDVPFVAGTCMLLRTALFERLGGFDERFFAYFEDWDLCVRAARVNARCRHVPDAIAWHATEKAQGSRRRFFQFLMTRNRYLMARMHLGVAVRWFVFLPYFLLVRVLVNVLRRLAAGDVDGAHGVVLGVLWLITPSAQRARFWPEPS